ncbi:MAG: HAMP domain-containing sensor histidine kinase [Mycobacteriales bacterium]
MFASLNVALMFVFTGQETIPFHFVWISFAVVYGIRPWPLPYMWLTLGLITVSTGIALLHHASVGIIGWEESAEVPLMAGLFLVMVWHVRRRQAALSQVEALAAVDRRRAATQQLFVMLGSHELRTPITVARGYTELIRTSHPDPATDEDTSIVLDELAKLERITARLLTLMHVEAVAAPRPVNFDAVLERFIRRWAPTADRVWTVESKVGTGMANIERLETALDCLVENAVKFTEPRDTISLRAWRSDTEIFLEVKDSGIGIPAEELPFIFNTFATGSSRPEMSGTGLGLPIVRTMAQARGGAVEVASTVGEGTTFVLRIPVLPPAVPNHSGEHLFDDEGDADLAGPRPTDAGEREAEASSGAL